jgi:hypothetical protein
MIARRSMLAATGGLAALTAAGPVGAHEDLKVVATATSNVPTRRREGTMEVKEVATMPELIAATALGAVLACSSPVLAQDGGPCDPQYSLNMWIENAPNVQFHEFSESQTAALMEVIEAPALPLFANTVGAVLILIESSPVGVVAFYDERRCVLDTFHGNAADIRRWVGDASGQAS